MWPFGEAYPERRAEEVDGKTFDYIVVGGGCAGCVVASRLSEDPSVSVLVLEKGRVQDSWISPIPLLSSNFLLSGSQAVSRLSEPLQGAHGHRVEFWTAEAVGGATRVNSMLLTRGAPGGFNEWAESFGLADWSWAKVAPYFQKSENALSHPQAQHRGHDGPVENRQMAPWLGIFPYLEKAARALGLPVHRDLNDPRAPADGYFYLDAAIDRRGRRVSAYHAWLNRRVALERRAHLTVCTGVVATRLEVDAEWKHVSGVYVRRSGSSADKREFFVRARREVIVTSGAVCSPQLLLLSGIGPKDELARLGLPLVHELPAVGQNLHDHNSFPVMLEVPRKHSVHQLETVWGAVWHLFLYFVFGTGLFANTVTPAAAFLRTTALDDDTMTIRRGAEGETGPDASAPRNVPDIEIMMTPLKCIRELVTSRPLMTFHTTLLQPFSRGRIELASTDPEASPRIHYRMLTDERDRATIRRGTRFAMRLAEQLQASGYPYPARLAFAPGVDAPELDAMTRDQDSPPLEGPSAPVRPGRAQAETHGSERKGPSRPPPGRRASWRTVTDEEIDAYVTKVGLSSLHLSSSCRMSLSAEDGVVDQRLRVHGLRNLRIADTSVFPKVPSAHTMAPTIMVAERCAEFVQRDWAERKQQ